MFRKSVWIDLVEPVVCLRGQPKDKQTINLLRGVVRLQLSHSAIVHSVVIRFIGTSKTLWPEASQHWDKHVLVDSVIPVCKNTMFLKKGTHAFPFEILLSNALSESIECGLGNVRYKLLCLVHVKPRFLLIRSILQTQRLIVLKRLPSLESQQQCITQTHVINDHGGQLTLAIEKSHLIPGTHLPISFHFNQSCSVHAVERIAVKLIERQKYRAPSKQTIRILHHEIVLSPLRHPDKEPYELHTIYVVPEKNSLKVRASTSHTNIRVRHWIQIHLRLLLKDGTVKDLQMDAPISVLLEPVDEYLALPVYDRHKHQVNNDLTSSATYIAAKHDNSAKSTVATLASTFTASSISSYHPSLWLQKLYPMKQNNFLFDINNSRSSTLQQHNNNLMMLITAPPPLYEDAIITPN